MTQACSLSCDHCRADAVEQRHPGELTTAEGRTLVDQVAAFDPSPVLVLSGGDPLAQPDLFSLVEYVTERVPTAPTERHADRVALSTPVESVRRAGASTADGDRWRVVTGEGGVTVDDVVLTTPADVTADLLTTNYTARTGVTGRVRQARHVADRLARSSRPEGTTATTTAASD